MTETPEEILIVRAGERRHGLRIREITEVIHPLPVAELPRVPRYLLGAAQFRSEVIPVIELAGRLGLIAQPSELRGRLIVVNRAGGFAGLLVDEVVGIWRDGVIRENHVEREGEQRVPLLDLARILDWRAAGPQDVA